jgi:phage FluMu gp28-like protein
VIALQAAPFAEQEAELVRILDIRNVQRCCIDATGLGLQLAERLIDRYGEHRVEKLTFSAALKSQLAGNLRVLAERGQLRIPADDAITGDWHSISRLVTAGGNMRFDADRTEGGHGDRFWAAALGVHAAEAPSGEAGLMTSGGLIFARNGIW